MFYELHHLGIPFVKVVANTAQNKIIKEIFELIYTYKFSYLSWKNILMKNSQ